MTSTYISIAAIAISLVSLTSLVMVDVSLRRTERAQKALRERIDRL